MCVCGLSVESHKGLVNKILFIFTLSQIERIDFLPEPTDVVSAASSRASPESGVFAVEVFGLVPSLSRPQNSPVWKIMS